MLKKLAEKKFVPLAIPVETMKKKLSHQNLLKESLMQNDIMKNRPMSMPQSVYHSTPHSRTQSLSQSLPISPDFSYNAVMNSHDYQGLGASRNNSQKLYQYNPSYIQDAYKSSLAESRGLRDKILAGTSKGNTKKRAKVIKKTDKETKKAKSPKPKVANKESNPMNGNWVRKQERSPKDESKKRNKKSLESIFR